MQNLPSLLVNVLVSLLVLCIIVWVLSLFAIVVDTRIIGILVVLIVVLALFRGRL